MYFAVKLPNPEINAIRRRSLAIAIAYWISTTIRSKPILVTAGDITFPPPPRKKKKIEPETLFSGLDEIYI